MALRPPVPGAARPADPQDAAPAGADAAAGRPSPRGHDRGRPAQWPAWAALALILAGGLAVRALGIRHGLPAVFHADEAFHFTSIAVRMFQDGPDPGYFQNPSGFTYLVHLVLRAADALSGSSTGVVERYAQDPSFAFATARWVGTALCLAAVAAVFVVARRLWGAAEAVAAAAVLSFAFLPVAYSRYAVTDVGVLLPVAVGLYGIVRLAEDGRRSSYLLAGAGLGFAVGFKYTAGLLVVPLLVAALPRARRDAGARRDLLLALAVAGAAFALTTPYFFADLERALYQLKVQREAAETPKLGQGSDNPFAFYAGSLTWALGWGPALAAGLGLAVEARRRRSRALLLALLPVLLTLYLSLDAERFFARWLLPAYPALALLAGVGIARAAAALSGGRRMLGAAVLAGLLAAALAQPLVTGVRTGRVLTRDDTRQQMRDFLAATLRPGARIVVDPAIPRGFLGEDFAAGFGPPPKSATNGAGTPTRYIRALSPRRIERYRRAGYCVVATMSDVQERARLNRVEPARAYYRALPREGALIFSASPYRRGADPVPFDFDLSTHLYSPPAYERPGPQVAVYRLSGCRQGYGPDRHALAGA